MPVFDAVLADIGDYQSIEQNLSTFSAHVTNIDFISRTATPRSLVLLDELGSATDPEEGAALAVAIADHFVRTGCFTIISTHHTALKVFGANSPGVINASVGFDEATLKPTYELTVRGAKVVKELRVLMKDASELYLATDEDREGEAISWHLLEYLKPKIPVKRMVFHEITKTAIDQPLAAGPLRSPPMTPNISISMAPQATIISGSSGTSPEMCVTSFIPGARGVRPARFAPTRS